MANTDRRPPSRIFVSYRRQDAPGYIHALIGPLRKHFGDDRVFRDTDDIAPGVDFVKAIEHELKTCSVQLVVIGREWLTAQDPILKTRRLDDPADYLRLEVATALANEHVLVIPVLVEHATMPTAGDLPPDLKPLSRRNATELFDNRWDEDVKYLIERLDRALKVREWLDLGWASLKANDFASAINLADKALALAPDDANALELRAAAVSQQESRRAQELTTEAVPGGGGTVLRFTAAGMVVLTAALGVWQFSGRAGRAVQPDPQQLSGVVLLPDPSTVPPATTNNEASTDPPAGETPPAASGGTAAPGSAAAQPGASGSGTTPTAAPKATPRPPTAPGPGSSGGGATVVKSPPTPKGPDQSERTPDTNETIRLRRLETLRENALGLYRKGRMPQALAVLTEGLEIDSGDAVLRSLSDEMLNNAASAAQRAQQDATNAGAMSEAVNQFNQGVAKSAEGEKLRNANRPHAIESYWAAANAFSAAVTQAGQVKTAKRDIAGVLERLRLGYVGQNSNAIREVYPAAPTNLILRSVKNCSKLNLTFGTMHIELLSNGQAQAEVSSVYGCQPKAGRSQQPSQPVADTFRLERRDQSWVIVNWLIPLG
jgi:tetratricopeptide (TPR) repeat protein